MLEGLEGDGVEKRMAPSCRTFSYICEHTHQRVFFGDFVVSVCTENRQLDVRITGRAGRTEKGSRRKGEGGKRYTL